MAPHRSSLSGMTGAAAGADILDEAFVGSVAISPTLRMTRLGVVAEPEIETFHGLYGLAFDHLKTLAFGRQVLTRGEFVAQMRDEQVWKYVVWDQEDQAVGLTTLTRALHTVPWISPDYFAAHYPQQWARDAVYYLGFTLAHPRLRGQRIIEAILAPAITGLAARRAVLAFDVCAYDEEVLRFSERIRHVLRDQPQARLDTVDRQNYSRITFE